MTQDKLAFQYRSRIRRRRRLYSHRRTSHIHRRREGGHQERGRAGQQRAPQRPEGVTGDGYRPGADVHIEAEKAEILVRCLNEGTDPLKSLPGKAHIHLVLILTKDSAIGMAKMRINSVILDLAESFRA